jgi:DNA-binding response OmpR family regulator
VRTLRVLVVDDDERILNFVRLKLKALGHEVLTARDGVEALEQAQAQEPDLVLLDVVMPKMDGMETLKELRSFSAVPVIILSAKGSDTDKIRGLGLGADDYMAKPFNPDELVARVEAVMRRLEPAEKRRTVDVFSLGDLSIDFKRRRVCVGGEEKYLTRIEWHLLSELARNAGRLMLYEELLARVWGPEYREDVQTLRTWMSRLRHKLGGDSGAGQLIRTMPKTGYIMDQPAD